MKIKNFQSQVCVCAASTNLICAKSRAEMEKKMELIILGGGLLICIIAVIVSAVTSVVSAVAASEDEENF